MSIKNRPYLVTSIIPEAQDLNGKNLILGPWCLLNDTNEKLLAGKDCVTLSQPLAPGRAVTEASDYCTNEYQEMLPGLANYLNSVNRTAYPVRYWKIIVGPWLFHFIGVLFERYKRIGHAIELFPDLYTSVLPQDSRSLIATDGSDFVLKSGNSDLYNFRIFSAIINELFPGAGIKINTHFAEERTSIFSSPLSRKTRLFNALTRRIFCGDRITLAEMYHLSDKDKLLFEISPLFKKINFVDSLTPQLPLDGIKIDAALRPDMAGDGGPDVFRSILHKVMSKAIPIAYIEGYRRYASYADNFSGLDRIKNLGSAVGWYFSETFKFLAAKAAVNGAKLIEFQHGGGHGFLSSASNEALSLEKDIFYSWGWNSNGHNGVKAMPSFHLSKIRDVYRPGNEGILFVGTTVPRYPYRFHSVLGPDEMQQYLSDETIFLKNLDDKARARISYRPYSPDYGWKEKELIQQECPQVRFVEKGKLCDLMQKTGMVIIDHPHTAFLEALSINCPAIFYWDHEVYLMRKEAEPYFELLRRAGILYREPEEAAGMVNKIYGNQLSWWMTDKVQKARNEFCVRYARSDKDWRRIWIDELMQLN